MNYFEPAMLTLLVGMVAWCLRLLGNHTTHRLARIEEKVDRLERIISKWAG
jgi:hypothetical protein